MKTVVYVCDVFRLCAVGGFSKKAIFEQGLKVR